MEVLLTKKRQITLPQAYIDEMGLKCGDALKCYIKDNRLVLSAPEKPNIYEEPVMDTTFSVPTSGLAIFCFQRFNLFLDGKPIHIKGRKPRELIAVLVASCESISKRACASFLWPESNAYQAMDSLYKLLGRIKVLYKWIPIFQDNEAISLHRERVYCDVFEYSRLCGKSDKESWQKAVNLYRGMLLYEEPYDWVADFDVRYEVLYQGLLKKLNYDR